MCGKLLFIKYIQSIHDITIATVKIIYIKLMSPDLNIICNLRLRISYTGNCAINNRHILVNLKLTCDTFLVVFQVTENYKYTRAENR